MQNNRIHIQILSHLIVKGYLLFQYIDLILWIQYLSQDLKLRSLKTDTFACSVLKTKSFDIFIVHELQFCSSIHFILWINVSINVLQ